MACIFNVRLILSITFVRGNPKVSSIYQTLIFKMLQGWTWGGSCMVMVGATSRLHPLAQALSGFKILI
jgi:hypothetical protein